MIARSLRRLRQVNSNNAAYNAVADTFVEPKGDPLTAGGDVVIDLAMQSQGQGWVPTYLELWPYGLGATGNVFNMRVIAWQRVLDPVIQAAGFPCQWVPSEIAEFVCTLGTDTGVLGGTPSNLEFYATTITITTEESFSANVSRIGTVWVISPGTGIRGHIRVDMEGVEKFEVLFAQVTGTPTMNATYRLYDRYLDI